MISCCNSVQTKVTMESRALLLSFLMLGVLAFAVEGGDVNVLETAHEELDSTISLRCIEKSVTKVSCATSLSDDSLMSHPDDCQLFYYCLGDVSICRECPAGLHFNPTKHVCDHPEVAGCSLPSS